MQWSTIARVVVWSTLLPTLSMASSPITVNDILYHVKQQAEKPILHSGSSISGPCTLIPPLLSFTPKLLAETINGFSRDDVWSPGFLQNVIFQLPENDENVCSQPGISDLLKSWNNTAIGILYSPTGSLPQGPYYCNGDAIHMVYRLYPDTSEAFMVATIQSSQDQFLYQTLNVSAFGDMHPTALTLAVPSRLYYKRTGEKPLSGLRLAVKDTQDVRGIRTSGSSRAYRQLHGPRAESAVAVQRLLDLGAVVIGKVKATQFGESEWATTDWIDYHPPFNPRADGYQTPSASSSGSSTAIASYDWLDAATGTDCSGSIRFPAAAAGVFGMRPSTGAIDTKGVIPFSKKFDTFGMFTRSIGELTLLSGLLYGQSNDAPAGWRSIVKPKRILIPDEYWPVEDPVSQHLFESFIARIEMALDVKRTIVNLNKLWLESNPVGTDVPLDEYFHSTFVSASSPDQWAFLHSFIQEYDMTFSQHPYLNPQVQWKERFLPKQTKARQVQGEKELLIFESWFNKQILRLDENNCTDAILLLPYTSGESNYRDEYRDAPEWTGEGWFFYFISVYGRAPEVIVPVGQTPFVSKVTKREEWLPAAIGIMGARGSDATLTRLISQVMETAGIPKNVKVGKTAFDVHDDVLKEFTNSLQIPLGS